MADKKNPKTLKDIRKKIDQLDLAILKSLSERVNLVIQAGEIKKKNNDVHKALSMGEIISNLSWKKIILPDKKIIKVKVIKITIVAGNP